MVTVADKYLVVRLDKIQLIMRLKYPSTKDQLPTTQRMVLYSHDTNYQKQS